MSKTEFWIYIGVVMFLAMFSAVLAAKVTVQRLQIETLQKRNPDKINVQPARYDTCKGCMKIFYYENLVVPELNTELANEQLHNSLMQKEIAKLRTGRGQKNDT